MKNKMTLVILIAALFLLPKNEVTAQPTNQLSQVATIDALLAGAYDGVIKTDELHSYGNFGLGTFDKLNGEMIVYKDNIYQIRYDGKVMKNDVPESTPFAAIVSFETDSTFEINDINDFKGLFEKLKRNIVMGNLPLAIKISGKFDWVKVRSVPEQEKPYKSLAEATKNQSVFEYENIEGTLIGFIIPEYFKSFNVPGLHVHFLSADETKGGHLLDLKLKEGKTEIDFLNKFYVYLPDDSKHFNDLDLQKDRSEDLEKVER